jgi:Fe-S cluster assembly protein SufD
MVTTEKQWQLEYLSQLAKKSLAKDMPWQQQALQQFAGLGFPSRKHELWKYNDLSTLRKTNFQYSPAEAVNTISGTGYFNHDCYRLVFVDGQFQSELSDNNGLPKGVLIADLQTAINTHPQLLHDVLNNLDSKHFLYHLNAGLLTGGSLISIADNIVLKKPIHLLHLQTNNNAMNHQRHIVIADSNSAVTIFEEYQSVNSDDIYFNNVVTQLIANQAANIQHYKLQQESRAAFHIANTSVKQAKDSTVATHQIDLGGKVARQDVQIGLNESGANCQLLGFYHPQPNQYIDNHLLINHQAAHTSSHQEYRGIMQANSHAVFNGKVVVHKNANGCSAHQQNKNLSLAESAEIDTLPQLEIYNDDVQCSHGATVGQLDEQALFYLRSRGIEKSQAQSLLTTAFATEVINKIPASAIKDYLMNQLMVKFGEKQ